MCKLTEIQVSEIEKWNDVVRSFEDYEVHYLNEYARAFMNENPKNGEPILLYYQDGTDRAINVVFRRDVAEDDKLAGKVPRNSYFDLITPYGYGGFWGNVEDYEKLNKSYSEYCSEKHYVCEFVRFELFGNYKDFYDGEVITRTHNVVRNLEMSLEELWMDFKQKVRKNVKRAKNNNLYVVVDNDGKYLQEFLDIYYSTMDRNSAETDFYFSKEFFETLNQMKDNVVYFHVFLDHTIISTELVIYGAENSYSYLGGTRKEYFELRPNDLLKYEIIKWAKEKGLKNFVLGGGYGADDGIFQYKTCLAPNGIYDFYIGRKIFDENSYQKLVSIRAEENPMCTESAYFPKYILLTGASLPVYKRLPYIWSGFIYNIFKLFCPIA